MSNQPESNEKNTAADSEGESKKTVPRSSSLLTDDFELNADKKTEKDTNVKKCDVKTTSLVNETYEDLRDTARSIMYLIGEILNTYKNYSLNQF